MMRLIWQCIFCYTESSSPLCTLLFIFCIRTFNVYILCLKVENICTEWCRKSGPACSLWT